MASPPPDIHALADERARARDARDFAAADALRDRISEAGWLVVDRPDGYELKPKPPYDVLDRLTDLTDNSAAADERRATVSLVVDGWPDDVRTCIDALLANTSDDVVVQALDLGNVDGAGDALHDFAGPRLQAWHLAGPAGWSAARTALLRADTARTHVWCDLSTVFTGDALTPLLDVIDTSDDVVGAGWRGVNVDLADEWRSLADAPAGAVDAVLGYLFAMRRSAALAAGGPHPKARFYRNADIEFSFALREAAGPGARLVVAPGELPVRQDRHRGYHDSDPEVRDKESARTYNRFLQRFRGRADLLAPRDEN
ncbi:MAG TPA: glycosyltransferase [Mycobacteriales bacterium]|nr:glycosyltransferase [Mycobacteriales bacterium]